MSDIDITVRVNDYFKVHSNHIDEESLKYTISEAVEELTKKIKDLSVDVSIIEEDEQEAIDIGRSILNLINKRSEDIVEQLRISRD